MQELLVNSTFFGVFLSLSVYLFGAWLQKKLKWPIFNPLLICMAVIIPLLTVLDIPYEVYNSGAKMIGNFLTPVTVALAVPLYRRIKTLKDNLPAVLISIACGCLGHAFTIVLLSKVLGVENIIRDSLMGKSVTTAIALGVTEELGGIAGVTIVGVVVAGIMGAVVGPTVLKIAKVKNPVAFGLGMGASSHAIGTSKALEIGEVEGAMSSLSIVVTGVLTVILVPIILGIVG